MTKKYVTNLIGDEFWNWGAAKVFIETPTGTGKTTFIIRRLLTMYRQRGMKLLILCNRRLLREQYWYDLIETYDSYEEMQKTVEVKTYQELAQELMTGRNAENILNGYAGVCLDEIHFFYSDSDFNGFGTYVLLQALIKAGLKHQMVFMSATMDCIRPWIKKLLWECIKTIPLAERERFYPKGAFEQKEYAYNTKGLYSHVQCIAVPDFETLCEKVGHAEGKSVIFLDDKAGADNLLKMLQEEGNLKANQIARLNADNMENVESNKVVSELVATNKLLPKVLLTTSVLDNGVSIHDEDVESIAIITESKTSFLQMLGRVRTESTGRLKLYLVLRSADFFEKRAAKLERIMPAFETTESGIYNRKLEIFGTIWNMKDEKSDWYRKAFVVHDLEKDLLEINDSSVKLYYGTLKMSVNLFAKQKLGDLYLAEERFYKYAKKNPIKVLQHQISWIGKSENELEVYRSTYMEEQKQKMKEIFMTIQGFSKEQVGEAKVRIVQNFEKSVLKYYGISGDSFERKKMEQILENLDLRLEVTLVNGRNSYSVLEKEEEVVVCS